MNINSIPKNIELLDVLNFFDEKEAICQKLKLTGNLLMIPTKAVMKSARMYHDCWRGACGTVQRLQTEKIEQEHFVKEKLFIKHNQQYKVYVFFIFMLFNMQRLIFKYQGAVPRRSRCKTLEITGYIQHCRRNGKTGNERTLLGINQTSTKKSSFPNRKKKLY